MKEKVGEAIAHRVKDGETIGVGTGSTVDIAIKKIGERVRNEGLRVQVVTTSYESSWDCASQGLIVLCPWTVGEIAWGFDGADEVDAELSLIKGRGGAMLKEKIVASRCKHFVAIVDETKIVGNLGEKFAVPIEVVPDARLYVEKELKARCGAREIELREGVKKHGPVITEAGNIILDVRFNKIQKSLERELKSIVGVVESGLFCGYAKEVLVATATGIKVLS